MIFKSIFQRSTKLILLISSYLSGFAHLYGQGIGIHYLHTQTNHSLKFPNGNIVVQLQPQQFGFTSKEIPWLGQLASTIHITAPGNLNPDQIIEIMLTAWTLKQYGAHHIALTTSTPIQLPENLPEEAFQWMLSIAGVTIQHKKYLSQARPGAIRPKKHAYIIGNSHKELLTELCNHLKLTPLKEINCEDLDLQDQLVFILESAQHPSNHNLLQALVNSWKVHLKGGIPIMIAPYLFYARSDKHERENGVAAGIGLIARLIEKMGARAVLTVCPHSDQSLALFTIPVFSVDSTPSFMRYFSTYFKNEPLLIISPDAGFQKKAFKYARELDKDLVVFIKERSSQGNLKVEMNTTTQRIQGQNVLLLDDETLSGSTLITIAQQLREQGAQHVTAAVTHLVGTPKLILQSSDIDQLIVTNTVPHHLQQQKSKLVVLSIASAIAHVIQRNFYAN